MPPNLWSDDPMMVTQRYGRYLEASERIRKDSARIEELERSLKIISTWAGADGHSSEPRSKAMRDISNNATKALGL